MAMFRRKVELTVHAVKLSEDCTVGNKEGHKGDWLVTDADPAGKHRILTNAQFKARFEPMDEHGQAIY